MPPEIEIGTKDDAFDDVMAAYKEVASKDAGDPAPSGQTGAHAEPAVSEGDDKTDRGVQRRTPPKDERGRFAKRVAEAVEKPVQGANANVDEDEGEDDNADPEPQEAAQRADKPAQPAGGPPPSWSVKSKASWEQLPADVRADIVKREGEVAKGLAELRDYKDLKPYAERAAKQGTTIAAALKHYTGIEQVLRSDIGHGLSVIVQNYGLNQQQAAQLFAGLAQRYGGQGSPSGQGGHNPAHVNAGQGGGQPQPGDPLYNVLKPFLDPLTNEVTQLRQQLSSREMADRNASQQSLAKAIETFSSRPENRYFSDLEETITRLFETGMVPLTGNHEGDLRTAYDTAAQMHPDVREALIEQRLQAQKEAARKQEQEAAEKAKKASRSITGSRVPGTVTHQPMVPNGHDDIEADVRAAYRLASQR